MSGELRCCDLCRRCRADVVLVAVSDVGTTGERYLCRQSCIAALRRDPLVVVEELVGDAA